MDSNEAFLSYLGTLDDDYYFLIATTVLGKVPSPFHKPVLNSRILSFLLNRENRIGILSSITREEATYLTMLKLMGKATIASMQRLFPSDSTPVIVTRLQNLKDRLVLIQLKNGEFQINPVLEKDLAKTVIDPDLVFGEDRIQTSDCPVVDRNVVFAILNLFTNGSIPLRKANEHHFIKSNKLETIFPRFDKEAMVTIYEMLRALAENTGCLVSRTGRYQLSSENAEALLALDTLGLCINAIANFHFQGPETTKAVTGLVEMVGILSSHSIPQKSFLPMLREKLGSSSVEEERILKSMCAMGMTILEHEVVILNRNLIGCPMGKSEMHVDTDLMVSYYGVPEPEDLLYRMADIQICDTVVSYRITKDSYIRAKASGLTLDDISNYLGPDDFRQTQFAQWDSSFSRVQLYDGIVLQCDSMMTSILKAHPQLQQFVIRELAEGLFLMKRSSYGEWQTILAHAMDVKALPEPQGEEPGPSTEKTTLQAVEVPEPLHFEGDRTELQQTRQLKDSLMEQAKSKGCLTENVKDMIECGLIVSKDQLDRSFKYSCMPCVSGFDYNAKLTAIKGAIKTGTLLKLELTDETIVVHPVSLSKADARNTLLKAIVIPEGTERTIPVSSMFMITVMRRTLGL